MNHALLIHAGALGDFIMALRVVACLRRSGAGSVTVLGHPSIAGIAVPCGGVDAVIDIDRGGYHTLFSDADVPPAVVESLRPFDVCVNMLAGPRGLPARRLQAAGIPRVIDVDPAPPPGWSRHVSDAWLATLRHAGLDIDVDHPRLDLPAAPSRATESDAAETARGVVLLHPGSGGRRKCWPPERFEQLAETLLRRGEPVEFMTGPVEQETFSPVELARFRAMAPTNEDLPLPDAARRIARAAIFVGNDSGASHLAAATGVPTVAVFGPTDAAVWRPLGLRVAVVTPPSGHRWPTVETVLAAIDDVARLRATGPLPD